MTDVPVLAPPPQVATIRVRPWPDPVIDTLGHDPRSLYAELFWLPTLGPTSLLLVRHLAHRFDERNGVDEPFDLPTADTSQAIGLGPREGRNSPLFRSLARLVQFDLAYGQSDGTVAVRRNLPPLSRRHARRLPDRLVADHEAWMRRSEGPRAISERRAHRAAFLLAESGADADVIERSLYHTGFQPGLCRDAATWATARHRDLERIGDAEARHPSATVPASAPTAPENLDAA